jgi:hypothetical protein
VSQIEVDVAALDGEHLKRGADHHLALEVGLEKRYVRDGGLSCVQPP